jgi:hypothetical protein
MAISTFDLVMMFYKFASKTIVFQETLHNFEKLLFFVTLEKLL